MLQTLARIRKGRWNPGDENTAEGAEKSEVSSGTAKGKCCLQQQRKRSATKPTVVMENNNDMQLSAFDTNIADCCNTMPNCSKALLPTAQTDVGIQAEESICPMNGNKSEEQQDFPSDSLPKRINALRDTSSSQSQSSRKTAPSFEQLNTHGLGPVQHSPATSPGGSSTHSQRSFHFHLPANLSNLRKSGVNLVRAIPSNIRRSSLAMFQMRAMGTVTSTSGVDAEEFPANRNPRSSDSGTDLTETLSLHRLSQLEGGRKHSFTGAGAAAKRVMRKRFSAAKTALRKISRISTGTTATTAVSTSSTTHSSPKTPVSMPSPLSLSGPNCALAHASLEEHPLRKCLSQRLLAAAEKAASFDHIEERHNCQNHCRENCCENERKMSKRSKKKRSWAASFVSGGGHRKGNAKMGPRRRADTMEQVEEVEAAASKFGATTAKKPLGPSLSWDPQQQSQRSRASSLASQCSRSRIHSDGSANAKRFLALSKENHWPFASKSQGQLDKPRQFEKKQQQQKKKGSTASKRRKKSTSALALCRGSIKGLSSLSLSTLDHELGDLNKQDRGGLELNCLHCALLAEYRTTNLRAEIECAVKRLAARLSNSGSPARARKTLALGDQQQVQRERQQKAKQEETERQMELLRRQMGTPDIVVSSCNSEDTPESADEGFWTNPSPSHHNHQAPTNSESSPAKSSDRACCSHAPASPLASPSATNDDQNPQNFGKIHQNPSKALPPLSPTTPMMDTLKPPGFPFGLPCSSPSPTTCSNGSCSLDFNGTSSPPRSNSVDLSQLRRDIELWSVSSLSSAEGTCPHIGVIGVDGGPATGISTPGGDSIRTVRSRSYDPSSSPEHMLRRPSRIEHLSEIFRKALAKSPVVKRAAVMQEQEQKRVSKHRTSRYWLDDQLSPSEHIWLPSSASGSSSSATAVDTECYLGEKDCEKLGEKRRCAACHIVAHTACFPLLTKMNLSCKSTFRDCASTSSSRRQQKDGQLDALQKHHWVHRWRLEGRCFHCCKSFQQKMFREKEVIAITCSWCKRSYHNKRSCFSLARFDDHCDRGALRELLLPPGWLLRLGTQRRGHSQQQKQQPQRASGSFISRDQHTLKKSKRKYRPFVVKALPDLQPVSGNFTLNGTATNGSSTIQPLLVFVNPKSGGNKGAKALNSLCWLLNPRQVFDVMAMKGPKYGLEVFRKIAGQMRILVCGGDGTVGWVLSTLDLLGWQNYPPIALLPLGTGNDLSRTMGWGGTFSDEPLAEILQAIQTETSVTHLDRWRLDVFPLPPSICLEQPTTASSPSGGSAAGNEQPTGQTATTTVNQLQEEQQQLPPTPTSSATGGGVEACQSCLPLSVMNNYFSIGADAHVALQFHHSRSANPQMLNSRLKNRIAYGGLGTIDLFKRTWKDLSEYISVECDGVDITPKIREFKFHCILFHNIGFYAGGTIPWGQGGDGVAESCGEVFSRPSPCDGKIEVLGFTTATLAALQMGGKGERIAQCSRVRIETSKPIPMQVDGEPCLLGPSLILLSFHNKVPMLRREKFARCSGSAPANNIVSMNANNRRKSSNNSASQSGVNSGGSPVPSVPQQAVQSQTQPQHKSSRASLYAAENVVARPSTQSPPNTVFMCVPVVVVGRHDYDTYRDTVDRLKDTGFELGTLNVEAEMELSQVRTEIQQMLNQHQILPYEPGKEWRFLDYVSNSEEGTFRVSRQQEQSRTIADVCSLEDGAGILILDDAFPSMTVRSAAIGHDLVFCPAGVIKAQPLTAAEQNLLMRRRISETLRIVLSSESQETHL